MSEIKQWPHDMPQLEFGSLWSPGPPSERAVELAKEMGDGWRPALALIRGYDPHSPFDYGEVVARFERGNPFEYVVVEKVP